MPAFDTWSQENLAKFAMEAYAKMQEQDDRIQQLQNDLKTAINAYRELIKGHQRQNCALLSASFNFKLNPCQIQLWGKQSASSNNGGITHTILAMTRVSQE